jgi:hypothetical protein
MTETLYLFVMKPPYSESVTHNGLIYKFLCVLKNSNFSSKPKWVTFSFTKKMTFCGKIGQNSVFLLREDHILD